MCGRAGGRHEKARKKRRRRRARSSLKDSRSNLTPIFQPNDQTFEGSFSAVSNPIFATTSFLFSVNFLRDLEDMQSFAPLRSQIFKEEVGKLFRVFVQISVSNRKFVIKFFTFFIQFCINFDELLSEFRRIFSEVMNILQMSEFLMDSSELT